MLKSIVQYERVNTSIYLRARSMKRMLLFSELDRMKRFRISLGYDSSIAANEISSYETNKISYCHFNTNEVKLRINDAFCDQRITISLQKKQISSNK